VTDTTAPSNAAAPSAPVDPAAAGAAPRSIYLDAQGQTRTDLSLDDINSIIAQKSGSLWVELDINRPGQAEVLKGIKGLHPLAVEDALCVNSRPKRRLPVHDHHRRTLLRNHGRSVRPRDVRPLFFPGEEFPDHGPRGTVGVPSKRWAGVSKKIRISSAAAWTA
jgi:hypothetical protein